MSVKVVDASALAAVLFDEPDAESVATRLRGGDLVAPTLLGFEIANVCLKKIRRHAHQREELLNAFSMYADIPIEIVEIDHPDALQLAEASGLTFLRHGLSVVGAKARRRTRYARQPLACGVVGGSAPPLTPSRPRRRGARSSRCGTAI